MKGKKPSALGAVRTIGTDGIQMITNCPPSSHRVARARAVPELWAPSTQEVVALALASTLSLALYWFGRHGAVNVLTPMLVVAIGSWAMWRLVRNTPAGVWTPLFSVRAAAVVFMGIGNLLPELDGAATLDYVQSLYPYGPEEAAKTNLIEIIGFTVLIVSIKLSSILRPSPNIELSQPLFSPSATAKLGASFLAIGLGFLLFIVLPTNLDIFSIKLPGSIILLLTSINAVGIFLVTLWAADRGGGRYLVVAALLAANLLVSLILMEKLTFMMSILLIGMAFLIRKVTLVRIFILTLSLGVTLAVLDPAIGQVRIMHIWQQGNLTGGTIAGRIEHYVAYFNGERIEALALQEQSSMVRLSYLAPSSFVVTQYDVGRPSDTIRNGLGALIPRPLWPDKPILSAVGTDLNRMLTGFDTSSLGTIVFADVYWNMGWAGLLWFIPFGAFLWWASYTTKNIVEARNWLLMPFVLVVFRIGMSVDNAFVLMWLTPAVISIALLLLLKFGSQLVGSPGTGTRTAAMSTATFR